MKLEGGCTSGNDIKHHYRRQSVDIGYAGLTPSGIGLYQINFTVSEKAKSAKNLELIVTQSGVRANTTKLLVSN